MKTLFFLFAMMLFSINLYSAPPDRCLWAPDLSKIKGAVGVLMVRFDHEDPLNRDSTLYVDTCGLARIHYTDNEGDLNPIGGSQYRFEKRYYSKSVWGLGISWSIFDTVGKDLNLLNFFTIEDIDEEESEIYNSFQLIKQEYGNMKFWFSLDKELTILEAWDMSNNNGYFAYIETENIVNSLEFEKYINELLPNASCQFLSEIDYTTSVLELTQINNIIIISQDCNFISIKSDNVIQQVNVYSLTGNKLVKISDENSNTELEINISHLQTGVYFIQINNSFHKFMVVR